jgi:hypothetical protein
LETRFLTSRYAQAGTRFRIYPQPSTLRGFRHPQIVYINAKPGTIRPGPADERFYVVDALSKLSYAEAGGEPPYRGRKRRRVRPVAGGHFSHLRPGTRGFSSAMLFATVRCVLDIWELYFGRKLFRDGPPRLELIPRAMSDNAWSKPGFIECGFQDFETDHPKPFAENFDVVAHEMGHHIVHRVIGLPPAPKPLQYRALDEGLADLIAIVSSLHFDSVVDRLLRGTRGNLFSGNVLSRMGELGQARQIRKVFNEDKMSTLRWDPDQNGYKYILTGPFTGGAFDVLVEIYQHELIRRGAVSKELGRRSYAAVHREFAGIQRRFDRAFKEKRKAFTDALVEARDYFGRLLARALDRTSMSDPSYPAVVANMLAADAQLSGGRYRQVIRESFQWRKILPGPWE